MMNSSKLSQRFALVAALWLAVSPAYGASKEIVQLQTQVQQLQEQMTAMKQSFDERMGVMKNLVEQNTDAPIKRRPRSTAYRTLCRNSRATHPGTWTNSPDRSRR